MISISYKQEDGLIYVKRSGVIRITDLVDYFIKVDQDFRSHKRLYILDDARESESQFNHREDLTLLTEVLKERIPHFDRVFAALVTDSPDTTALSDLYRVMTEKIHRYYFRMFSSTEAAKLWLKSRD